MRKPVNVMKCIFPVRLFFFFFSFHALSLVLLDFPQRHQAIYMSFTLDSSPCFLQTISLDAASSMTFPLWF